MIIFSLFLLFFVQFNQQQLVAGAKFRFDYTFSRAAEGWFKLHEVPQTWRVAQLMCHDEGAVLASPLTRELRYTIVDFVKLKQSVNSIFTGVHSTFAKGVYASIEGVPLSRLSIEWAAGEPDNRDNSESCLAMDVSGNGTVADVKCTDVLPFVCYKKRTKPLVITGCGTHDPEYTLSSRTGSCYKFHSLGETWQQAYRTCMAEGGHLLIINSEQEADDIKKIYAKYYKETRIRGKRTDFAFIGIYDYNDGGSWMTIHGETLIEAGFERWHAEHPNNGTQPEGDLCGTIHRTYLNLFDIACSWTLPFICEKQPESLEDDSYLYR